MPGAVPPLGPGNGEKVLLTLGAVFFGVTWNWFLLGTLLVQVYQYYLHFKRDPIWLKLFVYSVFVLDLLQTGFSTATAYFTLATHWGNVVVFSRPSKAIISIPIFAGFIAMLIQIFYAWRIWTLGKAIANKKLVLGIATVIVMLALLQGICSMIGSFMFLIYDLSFSLEPEAAARIVTRSYIAWLATSFVCDTVIAIVMVYLLTTAKTAAFFKRTNDSISRLLVITIASGAATAVCTLIDFALFLTVPSTGLIETPGYVVGKLFSNSLMVNLNSRRNSENSLHTADLSGSYRSNDLDDINGTELRFARNISTWDSHNVKSNFESKVVTVSSDSSRLETGDHGRSSGKAPQINLSLEPGSFTVNHPTRPSNELQSDSSP